MFVPTDQKEIPHHCRRGKTRKGSNARDRTCHVSIVPLLSQFGSRSFSFLILVSYRYFVRRPSFSLIRHTSNETRKQIDYLFCGMSRCLFCRHKQSKCAG